MFKLTKSDILFVYQGLLTKARGVDDILNAFVQAPLHLHIIFMGDGPLREKIENASKNNFNIHFHPLVKSSDVINYTKGADIGIHIIKNTCLNHYYCLPNKIFEYFIAGIPFIVSDFPEMKKIVNETKGGWLIEPNSQYLLNFIQGLTAEDLILKKKNIELVRTNYGWEIEELKYVPLYNRIKSSLDK
jgi:glycosyltransferase involved in cell wall biosynthesis